MYFEQKYPSYFKSWGKVVFLDVQFVK